MHTGACLFDVSDVSMLACAYVRPLIFSLMQRMGRVLGLLRIHVSAFMLAHAVKAHGGWFMHYLLYASAIMFAHSCLRVSASARYVRSRACMKPGHHESPTMLRASMLCLPSQVCAFVIIHASAYIHRHIRRYHQHACTYAPLRLRVRISMRVRAIKTHVSAFTCIPTA